MTKKTFMLVALLVFFAISEEIIADGIVGCPLGVEKGKFWFLSNATYNAATRTYWNTDPNSNPEIINIPEGWRANISKVNLRLAYGISSKLSIDFVTNYWDKDISKETWKKKPDNSWIKKPISYRVHGFGDIWLTALYKIIKNQPFWEAMSLGAGFKFDASDNSLVTKGVGTGSKDIHISFLTHENLLHSLALCDDIWYEYRGKIRDIYVKDANCNTVKWSKSGNDIGDAFGYRFNFEYNLNTVGNYQLQLAFIGWNKFADKNSSGKIIKDSDSYEHSIMLKFVYLPNGEEHEHQKAFIGIKYPVFVKKTFISPVTPMLNFMWTF